MPPYRPAVDRFWGKVDKAGPTSQHAPSLGRCWLWLGSVNADGYGNFGSERRGPIVKAHKFSYELHHGPVPDGLELDHLCHVRRCVNPEHLEPVTHAENVRRALPRTPRTHCNEGHAFTPENTGWHHGRRFCRECNRAYQRARYHAAKVLAS